MADPWAHCETSPPEVVVFVFFLPSKKVMGVGGVGNPRAVRVFQATCGRVLCVHRRDTVHALFAMLAGEVPPIEYFSVVRVVASRGGRRTSV